MLSEKNEVIALIDSGIGGVSVLNEIIAKNSGGNYIYFADNQFMPYGNKSKVWLTKRISYLTDLLKNKYKAKQIIIACNTASTCIKEDDTIITMSFDLKHTYYATELTKKNLSNYKIVGDKTLAKKIEKNIYNKDKLAKIIVEHISKHKINNFNEVVLGCTHYELAYDIFKKVCPNTQILKNSTFLLNKLPHTKEKSLNIVVLQSKKDIELERKILSLIKKI